MLVVNHEDFNMGPVAAHQELNIDPAASGHVKTMTRGQALRSLRGRLVWDNLSWWNNPGRGQVSSALGSPSSLSSDVANGSTATTQVMQEVLLIFTFLHPTQNQKPA